MRLGVLDIGSNSAQPQVGAVCRAARAVRRLSVDQLCVVATSAVRDATNRAALRDVADRLRPLGDVAGASS